MKGSASAETSPASKAAGARKAVPKRRRAPVDATLSRDPASRTFHSACRRAAPSANESAAPLTAL